MKFALTFGRGPANEGALIVTARLRTTWRLAIVLGTGVWVSSPTGGAEFRRSFESAREHWAFQPVRRPAMPSVRAADRVQTPVDAFLLAALEAKGLGFAPPADRRTLLRRLSYDLVGLPPTWDEIRAFEEDRSADAVGRVVDRLLASPRHGERWGRHWLDVARYADTKDLVLLYGRDAVRPYAYTYRDYVIRAFNEDLPFDQFVEDQLAADLVEPARPPWRLAALGFLTLGRLFDNNLHDQIDDQIDTVTRGMLGLTVACARCHDHKYDAVNMADYYGLYGVFASTEQPYRLPLIEDPEQVFDGPAFEARLAKARQELEDHIEAEFGKLTEVIRRRLPDYLVRAVTTAPDLTETTQFALSLTPEDFRPGLMLRTRRFLEQRAKPGDRVFGPWAELLALSEATFAEAAARWVAEGRRNLDSGDGPGGAGGAGPNRLVLEALARGQAELTNRAAVARVYGALLVANYEAYHGTNGVPDAVPGPEQAELLEIVTGREGPVWFPRRDTPQHMSRPDKDRYNGLVLNLDKLAAHATNAPPARAMVVTDLPEPYSPRIFARGNPSRPGDLVPRGFLRVLNGGQERPFAGGGSGRLELARAIVSPDNPLTARVIVNRVWMHHFGEPLVASTSDFGSRSDPPTHPGLLDWLASEFRASGWSWKHLHRVMVLSSAYGQGSTYREANVGPGEAVRSAAGAQVDPDNRLLWHYPRRRLDLEAMRDTLLWAAGRLDATVGGRPVDVAGDPLNRRRTVYGLVDRQNLPGFFRSFDFATPDQCAERRPRTTVPQQALFAMNSPFVWEQARALASLPEVSGAEDAGAGVDYLYRRILGRAASESETRRAVRFLVGAGEDDGARLPWEQFAQVLLASNEAVFLD